MLFRLIAAISLFATIGQGAIKDCDPSSIFRPTELAILPDPPVADQPVAMTVKFNNPGPIITDGSVTTSVTLNFIPFTPSTEPLCTNTVCPIPSGAVDRSTKSTWPTGISGRIVTISQWRDAIGQSLLCVQSSFSVGQSGLRQSGLRQSDLRQSGLRQSGLRQSDLRQAIPDLLKVNQSISEKALVLYGGSRS